MIGILGQGIIEGCEIGTIIILVVVLISFIVIRKTK